MTNATSRAVSILLCLALIWTAPGSAAHAAAGSAMRSGGGAAHGPKGQAPSAPMKLSVNGVSVPMSYGTQAGWQYVQAANQPKTSFGITGLGESLVSAVTGGRPSARALSIEAARDTARAVAAPRDAQSALGRAFDNARATRLESSDLPQDPGSSESEPRRLSGERARVAVTILAAPVVGGAERVLQVLAEEFDFKVDEHTPIKRHWGTTAITYVGHVPVENIAAMRARNGVMSVEDAPRRTLEPAAPSNRASVRSNLFHHWFHDGLSRRTPISAFVGIGMVLGTTALIVAPVALAAVAATAGFSALPGLFAAPTLWAAGNAALTLVSLVRWRAIAKTLPKVTQPDTGALWAGTQIHATLLLAQSAAYLLASVAPLPAYFLLGGSTWLLTGLLRQADRPLAGPSGPDLEPEEDGSGVRAFVSRLTSRFSRREPFVPATKKVIELEALAQSDPAAAFAKAKEYVNSTTERRREVKLAALRVIDELPLATTLPFYQETLERLAGSKFQAAKKDGRDALWYIQRNVLAKLAREAQALKALPPESLQPLVAAAAATAKDRNASVRLSARALLARLGVDPGPEPDYGDNALLAHDEPRRPADQEPATLAPAPQQPQQGNPVVKFVLRAMLFMLPIYLVFMLMMPPQAPKAPPQAPTAIEQVVKAPEIKAPAEVKERTDQDRLDEIAKNTDRNAKATERIAKSIEQIGSKMAQGSGGGFFSSIGGMILSAVIFIAIFMLVQRFFMNRGGGGGSGIGPNNSMNSKREKPDVRFSDVEGMDETIVEVEELVDFMRDPKRFKRMGMRMPKGLLFEGPPGTGKTMLAKAMAGEINANFFAVSGSEFVELYVGQGAARVRKLFADAKKAKPAVIFIDEIDAVGKKRGVNVTGGNDEREQTLNQILTEMQGFEDGDDIIVVAATNRMDTLDDALLRPGRFDYKVHVGKPNMNGREAILTVHSGKKPLAADVDLRFVARRTTGLAGAELEGIMNHAAKFALRRGGDSVAMQDIDRAIDTVTIGDQRNLLLSGELKKRIAYHEAGHALAALLHEKPEMRRPVNKFTIIPRDRALGFAEIGDAEGDRYLYTKSELEARIDVMLGGMVAEKMLFGEWSTGPDNDLERATQMARTMVERLGMSESMGLAQTVDNQTGRRPFGDNVGDKAHAEVNRIIKEAFARVEARLGRNRHVLDALVKAVYEKETLLEDQINEEVKKAGPVYQ